MQELGLGLQGLRAPASALPERFQGHREKWCLLVEGFWHQQPGRWEWGEKEPRRPVREQHKPRRERKPVRSRRFSVWVLSCSKSLSRMPKGHQSVPRLSSWNAVARAKPGPDLNLPREFRQLMPT